MPIIIDVGGGVATSEGVTILSETDTTYEVEILYNGITYTETLSK